LCDISGILNHEWSKMWLLLNILTLLHTLLRLINGRLINQFMVSILRIKIIHLHSFAVLCNSLQPFMRFHISLQAFTALCRPLQPFAGLTTLCRPYNPLQAFSVTYRPLQPFASLYRHLQTYTGLYSFMQVFTVFCRPLHAFATHFNNSKILR